MATTVKLLQRRKNTLAQLEKQLKDGTKPNKPKVVVDGKSITAQKKEKPRVPLTEKDIIRINKEILVLKERISNALS